MLEQQNCETRSVRGGGLHQVSWHSWKRQKVLLDCKLFSWLVWFTRLQQIEIEPLHKDFVSLTFKDLHGCHITSEMMLWCLKPQKLLRAFSLPSNEHSSMVTHEVFSWFVCFPHSLFIYLFIHLCISLFLSF